MLLPPERGEEKCKWEAESFMKTVNSKHGCQEEEATATSFPFILLLILVIFQPSLFGSRSLKMCVFNAMGKPANTSNKAETEAPYK